MKNTKLEKQLNDYENDDAFRLLSSIGQILDNIFLKRKASKSTGQVKVVDDSDDSDDKEGQSSVF